MFLGEQKPLKRKCKRLQVALHAQGIMPVSQELMAELQNAAVNISSVAS